MSKENKNNSPAPQSPATERCPAEGCKSMAQKMHFCNEHFAWYKEGLINKKGQRPTDFDKKYQHYMRKNAA